MISNEELLNLVDSRGSLTELFVTNEFEPDDLEDDHLACLIAEALPTWIEIDEYLTKLRLRSEEDEG